MADGFVVDRMHRELGVFIRVPGRDRRPQTPLTVQYRDRVSRGISGGIIILKLYHYYHRIIIIPRDKPNDAVLSI